MSDLTIFRVSAKQSAGLGQAKNCCILIAKMPLELIAEDTIGDGSEDYIVLSLTDRRTDSYYHLVLLYQFFFANVPLPLAPLTLCNSVNFFFAYLFASASSTNSSTSVRLR